MKRFLLLFSLLLLLCLPACVEESPEPLYDPQNQLGEERKKVGTEVIAGIFYDLYSDMTCEAMYFDPEMMGSNVVLVDQINGHRLVAISDGCFQKSKILKLTVPEGVERIGERALYQTSISSLTLPDSLKVIGKEAFDNCRKLEKVHFGKGLEEVGTAAFYGCALTEVDLSGGCKRIGEEAFASLSELESLILPEDLEEIGPYAFFSSGGDTLEIQIPEGVKKIGFGAFEGTAKEKTFTEEWVTLGDGVLISYNGESSEPVIPEGIRYLACDFGRNEISSLTLPASLEGICPVALENMKEKGFAVKGNTALWQGEAK